MSTLAQEPVRDRDQQPRLVKDNGGDAHEHDHETHGAGGQLIDGVRETEQARRHGLSPSKAYLMGQLSGGAERGKRTSLVGMGLLRWDDRPQLRRPVLVAAFEGWNDAGNAASEAVAYLVRALGGKTFAAFDSEELFDFTSSRPHVRLELGRGPPPRMAGADAVYRTGPRG